MAMLHSPNTTPNPIIHTHTHLHVHAVCSDVRLLIRPNSSLTAMKRKRNEEGGGGRREEEGAMMQSFGAIKRLGNEAND